MDSCNRCKGSQITKQWTSMSKSSIEQGFCTGCQEEHHDANDRRKIAALFFTGLIMITILASTSNAIRYFSLIVFFPLALIFLWSAYRDDLLDM